MTAAAKCEPTNLPAPPDDEACLIAANVNPRTGFATDYLNHFNEAVMLLELLAEMPECLGDFFAWQPKKYDEHFAASNQRTATSPSPPMRKPIPNCAGSSTRLPIP